MSNLDPLIDESPPRLRSRRVPDGFRLVVVHGRVTLYTVDYDGPERRVELELSEHDDSYVLAIDRFSGLPMAIPLNKGMGPMRAELCRAQLATALTGTQ